MYITTNPINQELFKNFEAARTWSNNNVVPKDITPVKKEKINLPVLTATALGTLATLLFIRKYQKRSFSADFTKFKNGIIKLSKSNDIKTNLNAVRENVLSFFDILGIDTNLKEMLILGGGSILGGLAGGVISDKDKKNTKSKVKEAIYQFINIAIPASLVTGLSELAKKYKSKNEIDKEIDKNKIINSLVKKYNELEKYASKNKIINRINKRYDLKSNLAHVGAALVGIGVGMPIASFISNKINNSDANGDKKYKRSMKLKDSIMHIDDIVTALIIAKVPLANSLGIDKILPLLYLTCGYEAGKKKSS